MGTKVLACSCNRTVALDDALRSASALGSGANVSVVNALCRRDLPRFLEAIDGTDDVVVTCTQESSLFRELADARRAVAPVRFINIREQAGWGREGDRAGPKIAALIAMAAVVNEDVVPTVSYRSSGRLLILGDAAAALDWAAQLHGTLSVSVLITGRADAPLPAQREYPVASGQGIELTGWLGAFEARWRQHNPIDLDACVRCGACIAACPDGAISASLQVDTERCRSHRDCVTACGEIGAIDFTRSDVTRDARYDLVLDLRETPAFGFHQPPQGYFHPGGDRAAQVKAALKLASMTGEFEKPKFFNYNASICAHGRSGKTGCTACLDVCSTWAIASLGDTIRIEPHLCMGCGGCTSVCPSGAISYAWPSAPTVGNRLRAGLNAYRASGGTHPRLLFHDAESGVALIDSLAHASAADRPAGPAAHRPDATGLPADLIPVSVHHTASVGLDLALAAIAWGAASVTVLFTPDTAQDYADALEKQFETGRALLAALGLTGPRLQVLRSGDRIQLMHALPGRTPMPSVDRPASFALPGEKRRAIEFSLAHLAERAVAAGVAPMQEVPLPAGAPFGTLLVDQDACTLCLACVGACPEAALLDGGEVPQLRFIERNCVQCGLCATTCPEDAITLQSRYSFNDQARSPLVLNEAQPFHCVSCGTAFATRKMIEGMTTRLASHAMFAGSALRRLQMCGDCRVVDMASATDEMTIAEVPR